MYKSFNTCINSRKHSHSTTANGSPPLHIHSINILWLYCPPSFVTFGGVAIKRKTKETLCNLQCTSNTPSNKPVEREEKRFPTSLKWMYKQGVKSQHVSRVGRFFGSMGIFDSVQRPGFVRISGHNSVVWCSNESQQNHFGREDASTRVGVVCFVRAFPYMFPSEHHSHSYTWLQKWQW